LIITDPSKRPSERFIEIVIDYFNRSGYAFKKSSNEFIRADTNGFEKIRLTFRISTLVSVSFLWTKSFLALERIVACINQQPRKFKTEFTLLSSLLNHSLVKKDNEAFSIDLYDNQSFKHDDFALNTAAKRLIELYEKYAAPFLSRYSSYQAIEEELNKLPITSTDLTPFTDKRIVYGIILARYLDRPNFFEVVQGYKDYLETMDEETKMEMLDKMNKTLKYLDDNNIQLLLAA
jgi:hypothetical protein